jgi:hypothetical protein
MKALLILISALYLAASLQAAASPGGMQDVGGDFGRGWLEGQTAGGPEPAGEDDLFSWEERPKRNLSASQYAANEKSRDWLDAEMISYASNASANNSTSNNTSNETAIIPYQVSRTFHPIHEMDSSFNQSIQVPGLPQPDKQGFVNGIPAEIYYSIGPAYFSL